MNLKMNVNKQIKHMMLFIFLQRFIHCFDQEDSCFYKRKFYMSATRRYAFGHWIGNPVSINKKKSYIT